MNVIPPATPVHSLSPSSTLLPLSIALSDVALLCPAPIHFSLTSFSLSSLPGNLVARPFLELPRKRTSCLPSGQGDAEGGDRHRERLSVHRRRVVLGNDRPRRVVRRVARDGVPHAAVLLCSRLRPLRLPHLLVLLDRAGYGKKKKKHTSDTVVFSAETVAAC